MIKKEREQLSVLGDLLEDLLANKHNQYNDRHSPVPTATDSDWEDGRVFAQWRLRQILQELKEKYKDENKKNE